MGKKYLFSTDSTGRSREIKVDPKHLDRQVRDERAAGRTPTVLDEDDRIRYGRLTQQFLKGRR
ncbi:hypothetical protein [Salinispora arenicola]|uniref:hypothetical protein n=1 Tax=Salinispora arenicola TaxID=168697 RepID=UPI000407E687|nr:hypothetical protein [Salinispora arenicola]MCN0150566.1 hypothetical protein [Salinispora arenicola]